MRSTRYGTRANVLAVALLLAIAVPVPAFAAEPENLGSFSQWTAWKSTDKDGVICYISAQPQDAQPANVNRDPIHFLVIHRKGIGATNEVQTIVGYPLDENAQPSAVIDGKTYPMVTVGSAAWLAERADEPAFVDNMRRGSELTVKGRSQRGTNTTDTYSLSGVTAAMLEIDKACT